MALSDGDSQPVPNTSVKIQLFLDDVSKGIGTGNTNSDGEVKFKLNGPSSGDYNTTVLEVAGQPWTGTTNDPGITK